MRLCLDTETRKHVIIKYITRNKINKNFKKNTLAYRILQTQIATLKKISHANINGLIDFVDDIKSDKVYYVSEYVSKGCLLDYIASNGVLGIKSAWKYFRQIVLAMSYIHEVAGITHRNLTLRNLLIDSAGNIRITDVGHRFVFGKEKSEEEELYDVPKDLEVENRAVKNDIWAMSVCLYYMIKGKFPYITSQKYIFLLS